VHVREQGLAHGDGHDRHARVNTRDHGADGRRRLEVITGRAAVLIDRGADGREQLLPGTRLGEEAEDPAFVHGRDERLQVRHAGQQHTGGSRKHLPRLDQELGPVDARHLHVAEHDLEVRLVLQQT
jgi:hypothetical protein